MAKKEVNKKEAKKTNKADKNKKTFFKSFKTELKKVVWPTPKQLANNTATVIALVLIFAAIVFVLDFAFETINKQGINRVRDIFVTTEDANTTENTSTSTDGTEVEATTDTEATDSTATDTESTETETTNSETSTETSEEQTTE